MKQRGLNEFNDIPFANPSTNNFDALNTPEMGGYAVKNDAAPVNDEENSGEYFVAERNRKRLEKAKSAGAKVTSLLVSATALTVFAGSLLTGAAKPNVSLEEVLVEGCSVSYSVVVDDADCKIELSNYFETYVYDLQAGENEGEFDDLTPNMQYTLTVYKKTALGGKTKFEERKIKTSDVSAQSAAPNGV